MKKLFALLLVCFMALGVKSAFADARTDALGLTAGTQVDDLDSIWMFPQDSGNYGNVVDFRLGDPSGNWYSTDYDWGGVIHKDFDEIGYIGIYYNRPFNNYGYNEPNTAWGNSGSILTGFDSWSGMINVSGWGDGGHFTGDNFPGFPYNHNEEMNFFTNFQWGIGMNTFTVQDPGNKVDLFWSKDYADVVVGAHFNYGATDNGNGTGTTHQVPTYFSPYTTNETYKAQSSVIGLDLGLTFKNIMKDTSLAFDLGYTLGMVDYSEVFAYDYITTGTMTSKLDNSIKDNNISELRVNALLKNKVSDTTNGRIFGGVRIDNLGLKNVEKYDANNDGTFGDVAREIYNGTSTYSDTNLNLGIACDHSVADGKAKVFIGLTGILDSRKWTFTALTNLAGSATADQVRRGSGDIANQDILEIPFNVAIEAPLFDWLTARMGASVDLYNNANYKLTTHHDINPAGTGWLEEDTANNAGSDYGSVYLTYGMSAKFNNLTIDMQLDPDALLYALNNVEPGSGILYGSNNTSDNADWGITNALAAAIVQVDARYAF